MGSFSEAVERYVYLGRQRIGFGLKERNGPILASLVLAKSVADIVLVGPETIRGINGFELRISQTPERELTRMLVAGEVSGIIRGTIDGLLTYEAYQELTGECCEIFPALFEDPSGREFFIGPISNPEKWSKENRLEEAVGMAALARQWDIAPRIAVYAGVRHKTYERRKHETQGVVGILNETYRDAEWIVARLTEAGYEGMNWAIDFNLAVEQGYNVHVPVNGMIGNQIFRALLLCGSKVLATPRLGLSHPYEDNSQTERDFGVHVRWLAALINRSQQGAVDASKSRS